MPEETVVMYVPFRGRQLFWSLANEQLEWVRFSIVEKYGSSAPMLFDGIRGVVCTIAEVPHSLEAEKQIGRP